MKLSLWTIYDFLIREGFEAEPFISAGHPCISLIKQSSGRSYSSGYAEILELYGDIQIVNEMDKVVVKNASLADVMNSLNSAIDAYSQWEHDLFECVLRKGTLQELLTIAQKIFARPMFIKNDSARTLAVSRGYARDVHPFWDKIEKSYDLGLPDYEMVRIVSQDPDYRSAFLEKYPSIRYSPAYGGLVIHANIFVDSRRVAEVVTLENGKHFNNGDVHLMSVFTEIISKYVKNNVKVFQSGLDVANAVTSLLEKRKLEKEQYQAISRYIGLEDGDSCVMVVRGVGHLDSPILSVLRERLESQIKGAITLQFQGQIMVLRAMNGLKYDEVIEDFKRCIPKENFFWAVSYEFPMLDNLPQFYEETCKILDDSVFETKNYTTMYEQAPRLISKLCEKSGNNRTLAHPDLIRLENIDVRDNTEYCETLFYYLLCGGNFTDAAAGMMLHRNTLIYRMNKIREIVHSNLDSTENRKLLLYSYLLLDKEY